MKHLKLYGNKGAVKVRREKEKELLGEKHRQN